MEILWLVFAVSIFTLLFALYWLSVVLRAESGTVEMGKISQAIREGANAFLKRQYSTIGIMGILVALLLYLLYAFSPQATPGMQYRVIFAFLMGSGLSALSGFIGMYASVRANLRVAAGLSRGLSRGFELGLKGGAVSGLTVVAMSLLGVGGIFLLFGGLRHPTEVPLQIVGFGFGASFVALFAQLGGGIYTKAADVGADLIGKVETGIPEDDPRNPAVIADLVGDNVGDCAGRGADLFESMSAENIGAMILGIALWAKFGLGGIVFPLVVRAFGLISTLIGLSFVRASEQEHPSRPLAKGFIFTCALAAGGFYLSVQWLLQGNIWFFVCGLVGLATAVAILFVTYYYTEYQYSPVRSIAISSRTGSATNIITGMGVALECTALPTIILAGALMMAYHFGTLALPEMPHTSAGLYGTAIATMGMLAPCAYILAMDTFGPIVDNAGGIVEMSGGEEILRSRCERLDATGNTTKALTKGYAIGSAALSAFLLFRAYLDEVEKVGSKLLNAPMQPLQIDLGRIPNFVGAFLGAGLVLLFSAWAIKAVGKAAFYIISEVRRQFREHPGILAGTEQPDYGRCVDIVTRGALKEMVAPGLLAVLTPAVVGFLFKFSHHRFNGAEAVAALLMIGTITGILIANMMNNGGAAWDNAKKFIELGEYGGKGSESHKAAVVGDTVGDPLKDTAGPSIHVLIKLLSTVSLVLAPLFL